LFLTLGRALAYATQNSPWTTIERACKPYATCSHGKGACGAISNRKVLLVLSSFVQACMPWMAAPRNEKRDETAGCGLRGLATVRDSVGPSAAVRDGGAPYKIMVSATQEVY
jgi:hypothetical protein